MNFIERLLSKVKRRKLLLFFFDIFCFILVNTAFYFSSLVIPHIRGVIEFKLFIYNSLILLISIMTFRILMGIYRNVWRYTNTLANMRLVLSNFFGGLVTLLIAYLFLHSHRDLWHLVVVAAVDALFVLFARFVYHEMTKTIHELENTNERIPIAICGAGNLGSTLSRELNYNTKQPYQAKLFIDNNKDKIGMMVAGLEVIDVNKSIDKLKEKGIENVIIAINNATTEQIQQNYEYFTKAGIHCKIYESPVGVKANENNRVIREFQIEDLLFRKPIDITTSEASRFYLDKVVLVTGGGGSIGSELCRQIAKCKPKQLIIFDIYENNAYEIQQELLQEYKGALDLRVEIGSVRDPSRLRMVFDAYRPQIVFHAAAHKHVPLMEHSGCEAIKNNVFGTFNTANLAEEFGVEKFILISTDKAVNPTNIMGASKRLCEMVIQCRQDSKTAFAAVRFGNVLGSNGSVIPLFKKQIAQGGPLTVTDKRIVRYFMTIPEASSLVMTAGAMAKAGQLFVLDMGKPVKIYDLACNMITLSGLVLGKDIEIKEIGLRPGEKLYEELLMKTENLSKTDNDLIFVEQDTPYTRDEVNEKLEILKKAIEEFSSVNSTSVLDAIKKTVPTYHEPSELNEKADETEEMKKAK